MLGQIEILLAFTAIMAAISLVITVCNQVVSAALNLRGVSLRWGLATLFKNRFPEMKKSPKSPAGAQPFGDYIANAILVHPLISDSTLPIDWLKYWRIATAIRVEELRRILTVMSSPDKGDDPNADNWTYDDAISWLSRRVSLMEDWFNVVMDRVKQHFTFYMRIVTIVFAGIFVAAFHTDSINLYKSLSTDVKLRNGVLASIPAIQTAGDALKDKTTDEQAKANIDKNLSTIDTAALVSLAQTLDSPLSQARSADIFNFGQFVTIALLSLGAPFWFNQLKNLSNLRSTVAAKEESERQQAEAASSDAAKPTTQALGDSAERNVGELL